MKEYLQLLKRVLELEVVSGNGGRGREETRLRGLMNGGQRGKNKKWLM